MSSWQYYLTAIRAGDVRRAIAAVETESGGDDAAAVYVDVIQPAMREVGRLWQENQMTVADEHLATAVTQTVMAHLFSTRVGSTAGGPSLIAACADTERHEVGLRMLCDMLEVKGWSTKYLGATVPTESLVAMVQMQKPDVLALSVAIAPHLPRLRAMIHAVRESTGDSPPIIIVGGRPFVENPGLCERVGADATAEDVRAAVAMLEQMILRRSRTG